MDNNFRIYDLTSDQCAMLDKMWTIDSSEDLHTWIATLTPAQQREVDVLTELMELSIIDNDVAPLDTFSLAKSMLRDISINVK